MELETVRNGSITTPKGFLASGITAGLKRSGAPDMALLYSATPATVAGAFTANQFAAAPVQYDQAVLRRGGQVRAVLINSGNANACTGPGGYRDAEQTAARVAALLRVQPTEVLVSSTGRIGVPMPMQVILAGAEAAVQALAADGGARAAQAIMTTDTRPKSCAVAFDLDGRRIHVGGMTKGAGMIAPRLRVQPLHATMLAYLTTDAVIERAALDQCLAESLDVSFNRITVDGDTSTNDTFLALANGAAGNPCLTRGGPGFNRFAAAFNQVASTLAREMVLDGEGVSRFVAVHVRGAASRDDARRCAMSIANSPLCKTAWFGADPNWGRILCAAGYSGARLDPARVQLSYNGVAIVRDGVDAGTPEPDQVAAVKRKEISLELDLGVGREEFTAWTGDLTYDYVKINADYHT